ncbi:hypothetical protein F383_12758 [Gossypium arboreum]|uniref:Uncharacterized protein n=1 Tax=Gossypium arboreum TaxID=29729 RepID=A0A0B0NDD0_GOSAR|nr:hypothetical protein F383_12758 [Gossypium arboreum]
MAHTSISKYMQYQKYMQVHLGRLLNPPTATLHT